MKVKLFILSILWEIKFFIDKNRFDLLQEENENLKKHNRKLKTKIVRLITEVDSKDWTNDKLLKLIPKVTSYILKLFAYFSRI